MKVHFMGAQKAAGQSAVQELIERYGQTDAGEAAMICAVGGDGTVLRALRKARSLGIRTVYGMRLPGSVGALGNVFKLDALHDRLLKARSFPIAPLTATAATVQGNRVTCLAINEIVLSRLQLQAARLHVTVEGLWRSRGLVGDGLLVSTAIGSGGYNLAAGGPLLSWTSGLLALTGIVIRPASEWRNCILDGHAVIEVEVIDPEHRPVRLETTFEEVRQVSRLRISRDENASLELLMDPS